MKWLLILTLLTACGANGAPEPKGDSGIAPVWGN
jgi:hypothetical protein